MKRVVGSKRSNSIVPVLLEALQLLVAAIEDDWSGLPLLLLLTVSALYEVLEGEREGERDTIILTH